jgi:hypothetical protein
VRMDVRDPGMSGCRPARRSLQVSSPLQDIQPCLN